MTGKQAIKCNVQNCKYNEKSSMCSLDSIEVGKTNTNPSIAEETECVSFDCM